MHVNGAAAAAGTDNKGVLKGREVVEPQLAVVGRDGNLQCMLGMDGVHVKRQHLLDAGADGTVGDPLGLVQAFCAVAAVRAAQPRSLLRSDWIACRSHEVQRACARELLR